MRTLALALALVLLGCAGPTAGGQPSAGAPRSEPAPTVSKKIVAGFQGDVVGLNGRLRRTGPSIGLEPLEEMVNPGLAVVDGKGELQPVLAQAVPSLENGQWKVRKQAWSNTKK